MPLVKCFFLVADFASSNTGDNDLSVACHSPPPTEIDPVLNSDILSLLGEDPLTPKINVLPLQKDLASRWENLLKNGLSEENRKQLIEKYPSPENCLLLCPPKVNPEVKAAVPSQALRRDDRLVSRQEQIGAALAAIGATISNLLEEGGEDKLKHIEALGDAGRLLADVHYAESNSRRDLISINLNKSLKDTLNNACVDGWLFGSNLEERVKTSKELEKSSALLKQVKQTTPFKKPTQTIPLNARGPLQRSSGDFRSGRPQYPSPHPQQRRTYQLPVRRPGSYQLQRKQKQQKEGKH